MIENSQKIKAFLGQLLPVIGWASKVDSATAIADLVAGFTIALILVPQSIAYASLAGFDAQYGLYSSFAGSFVYMFFGTTPEISIGPSALLSLLTFTYTQQTNADFAVLLCFLGGFVQLIVAFSRLGFLVEFVSVPVVSGFTSAAALIIACSQIKGLLGLSYRAETFVEIWEAVATNISKVRMADAVLSVICCLVLLSMRQLKEIKIKPKSGEELSSKEAVLQKIIWFTSVSRNAVVVLICTVVAGNMDPNVFILTGNVVPGLPPIGPPNFSTQLGNQTYTFFDMAQRLGTGILVVPLIGIIANVAIAKAFANGKIVQASTEIFALGICNVVSGFVQSIPVNGSFSRSAVSNASGVRTPAAGLYTGIIVLVTLLFLTPYFYFIPKAALASVIVCAVLFMIDLPILLHLWKSSRIDLVPLIGTFIACLFIGVEIGILIGIAIDVAILLHFTSKPKLGMEIIKINNNRKYSKVTPSGGLFFSSTSYVREKLTKPEVEENIYHPNASQMIPMIVVDCANLQRTDWTSLQGLKSLTNDFKKDDKMIVYMNCNPELKEKFDKEIGKNFVHCTNQADLDHFLDFSTDSHHTEVITLNILNANNVIHR